jgi:hypothetical protein
MTPDFRDWRLHQREEQQANFADLLLEERRRGFDLKVPPLMRVALIRLANKRWRVLWTYHHIILDGWSEALVLRALFGAYAELSGPRAPEIVAHGRYRDFVTWTETQDLAGAKAYWGERLAGFTDPITIDNGSGTTTPTARNEIIHGWREVWLSEAETARIEQVARRNHLTLSALIHGLWGLLLHRRSGSPDVVFGSVTAGRQCPLPDADTIVGLFVATQPQRTRIAPKSTIASWLRALQLDMAEMRDYEHTPLALIQQWSEVPIAKRPLFDTIVVMGSYSADELASGCPAGLSLGNLSFVTQPLYALTLFVVAQKRLSVRIVYDKRRYDATLAQGLISEFLGLLRSFAEDPDQELAHILALEIA